ncbi:MAG: PorP/SprF family type IX secretion system membrane protein [Bacteroidales bacterium]|nr:PorP/SprF family type IX secretion system membrane protein [Bacteroidales bacterium]
MRLLKSILLITFIGLSLLSSYGQDVFYSQSGANKLNHNPSLAGSEGDSQAYMAYRNQYSGLLSGMSTYFVSAESYISSMHSGIALSVSHNIGLSGAENISTFYGYYSYRVVDKKHMNFNLGIKGGIMFMSLNSRDLIFPDQYGGNSSSENFSVNEKAYDFGIGLSGNIRSVFGGIAIEHIARPNFSDQVDNYIPANYSAFIGSRIPIYKGKYNSKTVSVEVLPLISFFRQGVNNQFLYGAGLKHRFFYAGVFARNNLSFNVLDAVIVGKVFYKKIAVGYSYDYSVFKFKGASFGGSNELTIQYLFGNPENKTKVMAIKCPRF